MVSIDEMFGDLKANVLDAESSIVQFGRATSVAESVEVTEEFRAPFPHVVAAAFVYGGETLLRAWRKYFGLTLSELSNLSGVDPGELFRMERTGSIPDATKERLAAAMGIRRGLLAVRK